jgi:hypothetical protein
MIIVPWHQVVFISLDIPTVPVLFKGVVETEKS